MFNWLSEFFNPNLEKQRKDQENKYGDSRIRTIVYGDGRKEVLAEVYDGCYSSITLSFSPAWRRLDCNGQLTIQKHNYPEYSRLSCSSMWPVTEEDCEKAIMLYKNRMLQEKLRTTVISETMRKFP